MRDFRNYSQQELDSQYDQRTLVPDLVPFLQHWEQQANLAARHAPAQGVSYGSGSDETLDVFQPGSKPAPVHVHFHGGAWKALTSRHAWFLAPRWLRAGYVFVSVNFTLVPQVTLRVQTDQAIRALRWCSQHLADLGGLPRRLSVSGHSSGAHLAAVAALTGVSAGAPAIERVILASGVYDLEPVRLSNRNAYLDLGKRDMDELSPIRHLCSGTTPVDVLWSVHELAEFQRQAGALVDALSMRGYAVHGHPLEVANHFETWAAIEPAL